MTKKEIDEIVAALTDVKENRSYWFVRTQSGDYYKDFLRG